VSAPSLKCSHALALSCINSKRYRPTSVADTTQSFIPSPHSNNHICDVALFAISCLGYLRTVIKAVLSALNTDIPGTSTSSSSVLSSKLNNSVSLSLLKLTALDVTSHVQSSNSCGSHLFPAISVMVCGENYFI
jgi:hypothetical protein